MGSSNESDQLKTAIQKMNVIGKQSKSDSIKSKYILKQILENLQKKKLLQIIKYNKTIQNRLNINISDYIKICENFTKIEIELLINRNICGQFINISNDIYR